MTRKEFCAHQDHSALGWVVTKDTVRKFCEEVLEYGFGSVCVQPDNVAYAASILQGRAEVTATVGFPLGAHTTAVKIAEALQAIEDGADHIDVVINHSRLHEGDDAYVLEELKAIVQAAKAKKPSVGVKVIMYMPFSPVQSVSQEETIRAADLIIQSGADYIKFCKDFALIRKHVDGRVKMKHSGCADFDMAVEAIELGCDRIGHDCMPQILAENALFFGE